MKVFRILKITLPEDYLQLELTREEFEALVTTENLSPLFENDEAIVHIDTENRAIYFFKKGGKKQ